MGYQLYWVMLCVVVAAEVSPNSQNPAVANAGVSAATSGGTPGVHVAQTVTLPTVVVVLQTGAVPVMFSEPLALRSAGSCSSRIAFGLMGFSVPPAGVPPPEAVGGVRPRANPSCSHSMVTGFQLPEASLYSTRR